LERRALNKAIDNMDSNSTISLGVDADNVLRKNTLLQIASLYLEKSKRSIFVIQYYPMSTVYIKNKNDLLTQKQYKLSNYEKKRQN
jgi:hypothetical protein